jgi:hypothetical protein
LAGLWDGWYLIGQDLFVCSVHNYVILSCVALKLGKRLSEHLA